MLTSTQDWHNNCGWRDCPICSVWARAIIMLGSLCVVSLSVHHVAAQALTAVPKTLSAPIIRTSNKGTGNATLNRKAACHDDDLSPALESISSWFTSDNDGLAAIPASLRQLKPIAKDQVHSVQGQVWQAYQRSPVGE